MCEAEGEREWELDKGIWMVMQLVVPECELFASVAKCVLLHILSVCKQCSLFYLPHTRPAFKAPITVDSMFLIHI